jgi:hypothetical protein
MAQQLIELNVDKDNKLALHYGPTCAMIVFMLPLPFLCLGCCASQTVDLVFDDTTQTVNIVQYPGLLNIDYFKTNTLLEYNMIANVGYRSTSLKLSGKRMYEPVLETHKGEQFPCGSYNGQYSSNLHNEVLAMHRFVFGRKNEDYLPPKMSNLLIASGRLLGKHGHSDIHNDLTNSLVHPADRIDHAH